MKNGTMNQQDSSPMGEMLVMAGVTDLFNMAMIRTTATAQYIYIFQL
jgi:hypothetical protein